MFKIFGRIMANFPALGMRPHPLHPLAVRLWLQMFYILKHNNNIKIENFSNRYQIFLFIGFTGFGEKSEQFLNHTFSKNSGKLLLCKKFISHLQYVWNIYRTWWWWSVWKCRYFEWHKLAECCSAWTWSITTWSYKQCSHERAVHYTRTAWNWKNSRWLHYSQASPCKQEIWNIRRATTTFFQV